MNHRARTFLAQPAAAIAIAGVVAIASAAQGAATPNNHKDRVNLVVVDFDRKHSPAQELLAKQYQGYIPHLVVLDKSGRSPLQHLGRG